MAASEVDPMLRIQGDDVWAKSMVRHGAHGLLLAFAITGAGCSTDFRRLEQPTLGLNERPALPSASLGTRRNAGAPVDRGEAWGESGPRAPLPPVTGNRPLSDLPSALPQSGSSSTAGLSKPFDKPKAAVPAAAPAGAKVPIPVGDSVEVQTGDSLFSIAKRNKVSIAALMEVNQLKSPNLKPGQKLALPAAPGAKRPIIKAAGTQVASAAGAIPQSASTTLTPPAPTPTLPTASGGDWTGSYTVKSGDSLYAVARQYKVQLPELQRQNTIADPTKVRPGTVIRVPGTAGSAPQLASVEAPRAAPIAAAPIAAVAAAGSVVAPTIINVQPAKAAAPAADPVVAPVAAAPTPAPAQVAAIAPAAVTPDKPQAKAPVASANAKFRWPVKGQVIGSYGKRPDGSPSDGIAIAVPAGTDVGAAQDGTIAYAGSDLKGYGNLILVRHDGGWVTAYAHASEILVKRGDAVKRGQVIAKSGQTGGIDKPMVHFELRKDSQPIDPTPHMDKL
jgi:murein DD-endopeptidase MepM/ murein hydrolase activator NlpD